MFKNKSISCLLILFSILTTLTACTKSSENRVEEIARASRDSASSVPSRRKYFTLNASPADIRVFHTEVGKIVRIKLYRYGYLVSGLGTDKETKGFYRIGGNFEISEDTWNKCINENGHLKRKFSNGEVKNRKGHEINLPLCGLESTDAGINDFLHETDQGEVEDRDIPYINKVIDYINKHTEVNLKTIPTQ